jgi:catechol 2,3-dioxygenase
MGHIHLQVADVAAAERFYTQILGFEHMADYPSASFVSAGGYHHHLGMNSWMGAGAPPPPTTAARLLWYEIRLPDQAALDEVLARLQAANVPVEQTDQGWLTRDPSQNTILLRLTNS